MTDLKAIQEAADLIRPVILRTPLNHSPTFSRMFGADVYLKLENLQKTGSFKIRGASFRILKRPEDIESGGVVAASAGNHAQGVALAASRAGIPAAIVMPEWASISKQEATRAYGGEVILHGQSIGEALERAKAMADSGLTFIHPYDDPDIIAGQGTIGLEILEDLKDADTVVVPVGGGGLISGIAAAVKSIRPKIRVIGVEAAACPSAFESLQNRRITEVDARMSIADGIAVKKPGVLNFDLIRKYVDDIILVDEEQIAAAILMLLERKKILAEGAGAVPLAALMTGAVPVKKGRKIVLVISGGNVDSPLLGRIIRKGMVKNGRIMRIRLNLADVPGALSRLLGRIADAGANVLHIYHDRDVKDMPVYMTTVELELETRSAAHIGTIRQILEKAGYDIRFEC